MLGCALDDEWAWRLGHAKATWLDKVSGELVHGMEPKWMGKGKVHELGSKLKVEEKVHGKGPR
jgi:hypothetical protein